MPQLVWLVTGCSSGLGEGLVHAILARGDRVIATGRSAAQKLSHLKDAGAEILDIDVTSPQGELDCWFSVMVHLIYGEECPNI